MDPTIEDAVWKGDDGQRWSGAGTVEIAVAADGTVSGRLDGPLGRGEVTGVADESAVRAQITAAEEGGPAGVLIAKVDGEALTLEIRTSDGEGKLPRLATGKLERAR